jgi:hypothetical protein
MDNGVLYKDVVCIGYRMCIRGKWKTKYFKTREKAMEYAKKNNIDIKDRTGRPRMEIGNLIVEQYNGITYE